MCVICVESVLATVACVGGAIPVGKFALSKLKAARKAPKVKATK